MIAYRNNIGKTQEVSEYISYTGVIVNLIV